MKTREEQIAEHDAKPFPVDSNGFKMAKATAIVDENGAIVEIIVTSPYPHFGPTIK